MKVPTITAARTAILIANFAFILTFIVLLLGNLGNSCFGLTVASAFVESMRPAKVDSGPTGRSHTKLTLKNKGKY